MEAIVAAKSELPESLPPQGFAILNGDDPFVRSMAERTRARVVLYGFSDDIHVRATAVRSKGLDGVSFRLLYQGRSLEVETRLPGRHIVSNALAAAAVGLVDGMTIDDVAAALERCEVPLRIVVRRTGSGATLIDDTYNASPASVFAALDLLAETPGRRIAVLGDMAELGSASREGHLAVGKRAAETADVIHAIGPEAALIARAARDAGHREVYHWPDKDVALEGLGQLREGDVVLLKASRAMAFETLVMELKG
jgi:UDP-N-acetylmuramoyl-tripeptide--D-alanyl-D-alanine ligase